MNLSSKPSKGRTRPTFIIVLCMALIVGSLGTLYESTLNEVHAAGNIIYVKEGSSGDGSDWSNALGTLQEALDKAGSTDGIWIAKGTYYPTKDWLGNESPNDPRTKTFRMKKGVAIYGGFAGDELRDYDLNNRDFSANETILSGDIDQDDDSDIDNFSDEARENNVYHVFYHPEATALDHTAILDGVTITAGFASGDDNHNLGGGMYNNESHPTLRHVTFRSNYAIMGGGMYNMNSSPQIEHSTFYKNVAQDSSPGSLQRYSNGGGIYNYSSTPILTSVVISDNRALHNGGGLFNGNNSNVILDNVTLIENKASTYGGGLYNEKSSATILNGKIKGNMGSMSGGGMYNENGSLNLTNSIISGNFTHSSAGPNGGGLYTSVDAGYVHKVTLTNVLVTGNVAATQRNLGRGGGIYIGAGDVELTNVTISDNFSRAGTAGIHSLSRDVTIRNSIIWGNRSKEFNVEPVMTSNLGDEINSSSNITAAVSYSIIEELPAKYADHNNLGADPKFIDAIAPNTGGVDAYNIAKSHGDYRLDGDSAAINAGDSSVIGLPQYDLDGEARIIGGTVDIGAYEHQGDLTGNIIDVAVLETIEVPIGTLFTDLPLPGTIKVILDTNRNTMLAVNWNVNANYNGDELGSYGFIGDIVLPNDITNTQSYKAIISVKVVEPDDEAPTWPNNTLTVESRSETSVALSWAAAVDNKAVVTYYIYVNGATTAVAGVGAGTHEYTVKNLRAGTDYTFEVRAVDAANNASLPISVFTTTMLPPPTPGWVHSGYVWQPPQNSAVIDPLKGGTITTIDGTTSIEIPAGATEESATFTITRLTGSNVPDTAGYFRVGDQMVRIVATSNSGENITDFAENMTITFEFDMDDLGDHGTDDLQVYYWDEQLLAWMAVPTVVDVSNGQVQATVDHFTIFALLIDEEVTEAAEEEAEEDTILFEDIKGHWAAKDIVRLLQLEVVNGMSEHQFAPEGAVTRNQFAKMIVGALGLLPSDDTKPTFADAADIPEWAEAYVAIAAAEGIITGFTGNVFGGDELITREQMAVMIGRALRVEAEGNTEFKDDASISDWARSAVKASVEHSIISGMSDGRFAPKENATRAQAARMLSNMLDFLATE